MFWGLMGDGNSPNNGAEAGVRPSPATAVSAEMAARDRAREAEYVADHRDIVRFLDGDSRGFEALMKRHQQQAYGIALGLCGNHDDAMDATQKAFIRVHRSLGRFRLEEAFFPWLYRIVRNCALNQRRDERRHKSEVPLEWVKQPDGRPGPLQQTIASDLRERLWSCIQDLSPELREVFLLYHFQGLKYREIAAACDVPIGTVMSRLHAARIRLRQVVDQEELS